MRKDRKIKRRKKKEQCRKTFIKGPYKFAKGLFTVCRSGKLECPKEDLEKHLRATYCDEGRNIQIPLIQGVRKPAKPGVDFDISDLKKREVDDFVKKSRAKSSPGNDGVSYKVYKYCDRLRLQLFLLLRDMWRAKSVAERWCLAEGIYLPKEENSKELGQFRPISLLNIDGKVMFGVIANRIIKFVQKNGFVNESVQKAGIPGIPGCIEHAFAIWESIQHAKKQKEDVAMVWLDLANAYGSVPHQMIHNAMDFFWIPDEVQKMLMAYYNNFKMRFTTSDYTTDWQSLEVGIAAGCTVSVILFVLVMEMMLRSTDCQNTLVRTLLYEHSWMISL